MERPEIPAAMGVDRACSYLDISRAKLYRLLAEGAIPSLHVGRRRLVRRKDLEEFLEDRLAEEAPR